MGGIMKIGTRLFVGFGIILLLLVALWGVGRWGFTSYRGAVSNAFSGDLKIMEHAAGIRAHALGLRRFEKDMLINIGSDRDVDKYYLSWKGELTQMRGRIVGLEAIAVQADDKQMVKELKANLDVYEAGVTSVYQKIASGEITTALQANQAMGVYKDAVHRLVDETKDHAQEASARMAAEEQRLAKFSDRIGNITLGISIAALLLGMLTATLITRSISRPLNRMRFAIASIEKDHDFTRRIRIDSNDEVGQTAKAFNNLVATLQQSLSQVVAGVSQVSGAAQSLSSSSTQVAQSSSAQSEAASSMAAAVEQMTVSIGQVSDSAREAVDISRKSGDLSAEGGGIIQSASSEMTKIAEAVRHTAAVIEQLGDHSHQISSIVQVIKEVAEQTNLLALNAAIEAARAGEQGRGFAVVADEVRRLAERTSMATEEITRMIAAMQGSSHAAVSTMSSMVEKVGGGVELASRAGSSIVRIKDGAEQVVGVVNDISSALDEQSRASNDIACQVEKVAQMTEQNRAAAAETASTAISLQELADSMLAVVRRFKIGDSSESTVQGELRMSA
ncbi:MAG TPA: methyl-accepting chemotaxis protein [Gallionella sp.]|nr:methyl-accepting chemotaxis protein [Gallionella sp.]